MVNDNDIIRREGWCARKAYGLTIDKLNTHLLVIAGYNKERVEAGDIGPLQTALGDAKDCYDAANQHKELFETEDAEEMEILEARLKHAEQKVIGLENCE